MPGNDQNKLSQKPQKKSVPNPFAPVADDSSSSGAPPNIPVADGVSMSPQPKPEPKTPPAPVPKQVPKAEVQKQSRPQAAAQKAPLDSVPFADEVLHVKEAPRKNPNLNKSQVGEVLPPESKMGSISPEIDIQPSISESIQPDQVQGQGVGDVPNPSDGFGAVPPLQEVPPGVSGEDLLKSLADTQVSSSEKKALFYKLITGLVVIGFLGLVTFGAVFAFNKWVKPTLNNPPKQNTNVNTDLSQQNTNTVATPTEPSGNGDSDGDSMPDAWENQYSLNPNDSTDALDDPDFDQLRNKDEFIQGTNPQNPDTDADGFRDGAEVQQGYNPNGPGKLNESSGSSQGGSDFKVLQGSWLGNFNGAHLVANDLEFKLDDAGEILGTYNFSKEDGVRIFSRAKGAFTYNNSTGQFNATMSVKGFYEQESIDYTLKLVGQGQGEGKISGTWNIVPAREVSWISTDNGTFTLNK